MVSVGAGKGADVMRWGSTLVILATLLAGCSSLRPKTEDQATLSLACELSPCVCRATTKSFWAREGETKPVEYRRDGSAFCPANFRLERTSAKTPY